MSPAPQIRLSGLILALCTAAAMAWGCNGCNSAAKPPSKSEAPTLRLYLLAGVAGAIEPCGCVKDMLGGVDHAAAYLAAQTRTVPNQLVVGAGPMLFSDPSIDSDHSKQAEFKAMALAESFRDIGLAAWAPGANDWALGAERLSEFAKVSGAKLLAANLKAQKPPLEATALRTVNGLKVGFAGVVVGTPRPNLPEGLDYESARTALASAQKTLSEQGAELQVALVAAPRGDALRLVEQVPGFQLVVLGKSLDQGENNDEPIPPTIVGNTLAAQAPNHLQSIGSVDLFVRGDDYTFSDGTGVEKLEKKQSLAARIEELEQRIAEWEKSGVGEKDLAARREDLKKLQAERAALDGETPVTEGSFYTYELVDVRESLGVEPKVKGRLAAYYKRVNQHNREVFKDKLPPPLAEGEAGYLGVEKCAACHLEEAAFWKTTRHAKAYETLVKDHKQFNLDCVSCHVSGYEKPGGSTVTHVQGLTDVQCEVCHGPGSRHVANPADPKAIQAAPDRALCAQACHHPPHVKKDWSVDAAWKLILGPGHGR
ncbi:MAG TPA: multiheme c-type cytochrome [Polyangiaceae bacterium]|nr:multiheme c-type cytochrome [Polyangiaceae bacterium]